MSRRHLLAALTLALVWLLSAVPSAEAQKTYKWTDAAGKVHYSNVAPAGEHPEEPSGVTGVDASTASSEPVAAEPASEAPAPSAAATTSSSSGVSDEAFSSPVSATRLRLKRELAQAKEDARVAGEKLERAKSDLDRAQKPGLEMLQAAMDPAHQHDSDQVDDLKKRKDKAEAKITDIRA